MSNTPFVFKPRKPCVDKQCATCPFREGGGVLKDHPQGLATIKMTVGAGMEFYCHKTVYKKKVTPALIADPTAEKRPESEWRFCSGAYDFKMGLLKERAKDFLRGTIKTRDGLLVDYLGEVIHLPRADDVAREAGFQHAEEFVRWLETHKRFAKPAKKRKP